MTESFAIAPSQSGALWIVVGFVGLLVLGVMGILVATTRGASNSRFDVSPEGIRIRGDIYGRVVPASTIRRDAVRAVNLATEPDLAPRRRTMGTAMPGYHSGWYRLQNGRKALLYLTDQSRAVYVPTSGDYDLLLSPAEPERFVATLKAPGGTR